LTVTDESFATAVLRADRPVVVDFWAEWCPPCKVLARTLDELAPEFGDRLLLTTMNADENPAVARRYGVMALPTLLVFSGGELVASMVGARPKSILREALGAYAAAAGATRAA
jgi:thioredoxin 1